MRVLVNKILKKNTFITVCRKFHRIYCNADTLHQSSLTDACYMLSAARCNAALVSGSQHVCSITSSVSHYSVLVYADSNTRLIDLLLPLY